MKLVAHRDGRRRRVPHHQWHGERRDRLRPALAKHTLLLLQRAETADSGSNYAADPPGLMGDAVRPAGLGEGLVARGERELREAVAPPRFLARQEIRRI